LVACDAGGGHGKSPVPADDMDNPVVENVSFKAITLAWFEPKPEDAPRDPR